LAWVSATGSLDILHETNGECVDVSPSYSF
jgi:hypothetical protein